MTKERDEKSEQIHGLLEAFNLGQEYTATEILNFNDRGPQLAGLIEAIDIHIAQAQEDRAHDVEQLMEKRKKLLTIILNAAIASLYEGHDADDLIKFIQEAIEEEQRLLQDHKAQLIPEGRPDRGITKVVYPDTYGDFSGLIEAIPLLSELGVTTLHILPPYECDGTDAGFSVICYEGREIKISEKWGSAKDFEDLVATLEEYDMRLMLDAVLNHLSVESPYLQAHPEAFLSWEQLEQEYGLEFNETRTGENGGEYAVYQDSSGEEYEWLIIFPEQIPEDANIPHVVEVTIDKEKKDFFHVFYPSQIDLDYREPEAMKVASKIILQIIDFLKGRGIIRLDAIPFVFKFAQEAGDLKYTDADKGFRLITVLRLITALAAPNVDMIAESARPRHEIGEYAQRVGANYDFTGWVNLILSILQENPENLIEHITSLIYTSQIGLAGLKRLLFVLATHDDMPLAELTSGDAAEVYKLAKDLGAVDFGKNSKNGIPKGLVFTLFQMCDKDIDKYLAAIALSSFTPHQNVLLFGDIELGGLPDKNYYQKTVTAAQNRGQKADKRALIRSPSDVSLLEEALDKENPITSGIQEIFKIRGQVGEITDWTAEAADNGLAIINFTSENGRTYLAVVNINGGSANYELPSNCEMNGHLGTHESHVVNGETITFDSDGFFIAEVSKDN